MIRQNVEGQGRETTHEHDLLVHEHDHYHLSHHKGELMGSWEHREYWHTHEHNHAPMRHGHDYSMDDEEQHHGKEAHIHDHDDPAGGGFLTTAEEMPIPAERERIPSLAESL